MQWLTLQKNTDFSNVILQGSISIATGEGNVINDKRFLGPSLDITTDSGDIRKRDSTIEKQSP